MDEPKMHHFPDSGSASGEAPSPARGEEEEARGDWLASVAPMHVVI